MALVHPTVSFRIQNEFENDSITIKNVKIQHARFHKKGDQEAKLEISDIENLSVSACSWKKIYIRADYNWADGCDGTFEIHDGDNMVCTVYWSLGMQSNQIYIYDKNSDYIIEEGPWSLERNLGEVRVTISKKDG